MTNNQKLTKLTNIRTDLRDDADHISTINSKIQSVADEFESLLKQSPNTATVKSNIEALKEPSQANDSKIQNALTYCQNEINKVDTDIKAAAATP